MEYQFDISLGDHHEFAAFLRDQIRAFNDEHSPYHKAARKVGAVIPIHIKISNVNKQWVGGISGEVYWNWVEINPFLAE